MAHSNSIHTIGNIVFNNNRIEGEGGMRIMHGDDTLQYIFATQEYGSPLRNQNPIIHWIATLDPGLQMNIVKTVLEHVEKQQVKDNLPTDLKTLCDEFSDSEEKLVATILGWPRTLPESKQEELSLHDALVLFLIGAWTREHPDMTAYKETHNNIENRLTEKLQNELADHRLKQPNPFIKLAKWLQP